MCCRAAYLDCMDHAKREIGTQLNKTTEPSEFECGKREKRRRQTRCFRISNRKTRQSQQRLGTRCFRISIMICLIAILLAFSQIRNVNNVGLMEIHD